MTTIITIDDSTPNTFPGGSALAPYGTSSALSHLCNLIITGRITVTSMAVMESIADVPSVYRIEVSGVTYWVNSYWAAKIEEASALYRNSSEELEDILPEIMSNEVLPESEEEFHLSEEEEGLLSAALLQQEAQVVAEIPVNSPTIKVETTSSRFSGAIWYNKITTKTIILAGLGGIGSYVAFLLSRLQLDKIIMYDDDVVDTTNMSGQLYSTSDVGNTKVSSITRMVKNYSAFYRIDAVSHKYRATSSVGPIMICGFDNMEARKIFYANWKRYRDSTEYKANCLFIDGRLAAEEFQVLCIQGDNEEAMKLYETEWLFSDAEAEETLCSYKQTTFMANMIGSVMVNLFVNFVANECDPIFPRDVPFLTSYDASRMYFKVEM